MKKSYVSVTTIASLLVIPLFLLFPVRASSVTCTASSSGVCTLGVGGSFSFTGTQTSPGPTSVTITISRPTTNVLKVDASTSSISSDACVLSLGGTFNVQVRLKPNPVSPPSQFIVMQTTDASVGAFGGQPDYVSATGNGHHDGPETLLSTIGITATFSGGDPTHGCVPLAPAEVTYSIPFGTGAGQYSAISFLGTQPFGFVFFPPNGVTVAFS